jgi:hypothetical protein
MRAASKMVRNTARESTNSQMALHIRAAMSTEYAMERVLFTRKTEESDILESSMRVFPMVRVRRPIGEDSLWRQSG